MEDVHKATVKTYYHFDKLTIDRDTIAYQIFKGFILCNDKFDGSIDLNVDDEESTPTIEIVLDYCESDTEEVMEDIVRIKEVLEKGDVTELDVAYADAKHFAYEKLLDTALDYIHTVQPYPFGYNAPEFINSPVVKSFTKWFNSLPITTNINDLPSLCLTQYMILHTLLILETLEFPEMGELDFRVY